MKKILYIAITILFITCDSDKGLGCFTKAGTIIEREITVDPFTRIVVFERVQLFIEEGPIQKVIIKTGDNLINEVEVKVEGDLLSVIDNNSCNFIRDYDITKVYVISPNITEIRNSSSLEITSLGVLSFPEINLYSENFGNEDVYRTNGDFNLTLNVEEVKITSNGISTFQLSGNANKATFGLFSGNTRVLAENLIINDLHLYHRSSNKMVVNPIMSIQGEIVSIGNVIAKNRPPIVEVEELFEGKLIFED